MGLPRRRAEPHVPVERLRDLLHGQVHAAGPVELPAEALTAAERALDRTLAEETALDDLADRLHGRAEAVEVALEAEPRVETEDALLGLDDLHHALALANGAGHGLLAPDVLAGVRGHHAHAAVPVRRRADVDDVHVLVGEQLDEVLVALDLAPAAFRGGGEAALHA